MLAWIFLAFIVFATRLKCQASCRCQQAAVARWHRAQPAKDQKVGPGQSLRVRDSAAIKKAAL